MLNIKTLLPELKKLVTDLSEDLLSRVTENFDIKAGLEGVHAQTEKGGRTTEAFEVWLEDYLDQVAVAWVLACVFIRFMEDNELIDECWLAGIGERRKQSEDAHILYFRENPHDSDREYFEHVFHKIGEIPAAAELFNEGKTPLWAVGPTGDAARNLLKFWQEIDTDTGHLRRSLKVTGGDTRFLGDLYQDLSERAKKKFALLQTPVFVEEFILDRTLIPAMDEFGLESFRMIDPACGSGHFLLGAFARLFDMWIKRESNEIKAAQKALDGVWGVDINPFAVAIARFRLVVAAIQACDITRLKKAPGWDIHLASGDSLLFGSRPSFGGERVVIGQQLDLFEVPAIYATEDRKALQAILGQGYHVVVGNPPYIVVKDKAQNEAYRSIFSKVCHRQYSLAVPFTQRFWELAIQVDETQAKAAGHIGMITSNSFMKREFGRKLIEDFLPKVDLTHVVDTSGASIPGHGTPTVILFGRNRRPQGDTVRAVLGIKGEPSTPVDPSQGVVWQSIIRQIDIANAQDEFTSTSDVPRTTFASHPWSIGGGGASELKARLDDNGSAPLDSLNSDIGFGAVTREDDVFIISAAVAKRHKISDDFIMPIVVGENVRDWTVVNPVSAIFPYDGTFKAADVEAVLRFLWPWKKQLCIRVAYGLSQLERGLKWFEYSMLFENRLRIARSITFAFVATHNHFVLDRGGKVFNRTAPIIKLPALTDDDHLSLLGLLNSSIACFWMQQTLHNKGGPGGGSSKDEKWHDFYEFTATSLQRFPVAKERPFELARELDNLARQYSTCLPDTFVQNTAPTYDGLKQARKNAASIRARMIALQEELDWKCYRLYGLLEDDLTFTGDDLPELALGERAFEIVMARQLNEGQLSTKWFEWLQIKPIMEISSHWPVAYRKLVERRIQVIETNEAIALIEKADCKRRWETEPWDIQEQKALKKWLLDRLETSMYCNSRIENPNLTTTAQIAELASADSQFNQVSALYRGRSDFDIAALVSELVEEESVPLLPILRYGPTGLRKRAIWEGAWKLQRQEDIGADVVHIPIPPRYGTADYQKTNYWRLRGKLDVPKEQWISYPYCEREGDPSLVVGWAGMNYLQQATALVAYYDARKREGWTAARLKPLLAGLDQLLPWIHQWHPEIDPEYNETAGTSFQTLLDSEAQELGLTLEDIRNWKPPKTTTIRRKKKV